MKITATKNSEVVYLQVVDGNKNLHKVLGRLTEVQAGSDIQVTVENNGHKFPFSLVDFDLEPVIRDVNGIISKTPTKTAAKSE